MSDDAGGAGEKADEASEVEAPRPAKGKSAGEDEAEASAAAEPAPLKKRKKKKRKKAGEADVAEAEAPRDDVPAFALSFPRDPALDALVEAFEQGDYARVRRESPALAKATDSDEVRAAARELARRVEPDPLAVYLLLGAAALLVFLAGWYWSHPHVP